MNNRRFGELYAEHQRREDYFKISFTMDKYYAHTYDGRNILIGSIVNTVRDTNSIETEYIIGKHHCHFIHASDGELCVSGTPFMFTQEDLYKAITEEPDSDEQWELLYMINEVTEFDNIEYFVGECHIEELLDLPQPNNYLTMITEQGIIEFDGSLMQGR